MVDTTEFDTLLHFNCVPQGMYSTGIIHHVIWDNVRQGLLSSVDTQSQQNPRNSSMRSIQNESQESESKVQEYLLRQLGFFRFFFQVSDDL